MNLSGKVVAITGGFGILGQATAAIVAAQGAKIALIDRVQPPASSPLSGALLFGGVDLTDEQAATTTMQQIAAQAGRLDALVNIAGGFRWETLQGGALASWDFMYQLNLRTAVTACKAALPHLLQSGRGRIVNIGAMGANKAAAGMGAYAASKAGIAKLTEALAEELKDQRVTVNAVLPSILDTAQNRADMPDADFTRWVTPAEVAEVITFLLSDKASPVTGALIPVVGRV